MPAPIEKICDEPGCCEQVYRKKNKCRRHYQKEYRRAINYKAVDHAKNQVKVTNGNVFVNGLQYKIGFRGKAYYLLGREWKLSSRDPRWVAEQLAKVGGGEMKLSKWFFFDGMAAVEDSTLTPAQRRHWEEMEAKQAAREQLKHDAETKALQDALTSSPTPAGRWTGLTRITGTNWDGGNDNIRFGFVLDNRHRIYPACRCFDGREVSCNRQSWPLVLCGCTAYSNSYSDLGCISVVGRAMTTAYWFLYIVFVALFTVVVASERLYQFWIIELGEKARLYEDMCRKMDGLDSVEWF